MGSLSRPTTATEERRRTDRLMAEEVVSWFRFRANFVSLYRYTFDFILQ